MALKVFFCAATLLVNLQVVRNEGLEAATSINIDDVQANIKNRLEKAHGDINQQIQDIMSRILFIRDSEIFDNMEKLSTAVTKEIGSLEQLLTQIRGEEPENECLNNLDADHAQAIQDAGSSFFQTCVAHYPPGGSVNMDISDVKQNFQELEQSTSDSMKACNQVDEAETKSCIASLDETFKEELAKLKDSKIKHLKAEANEAEILERVKINDCMKEAITNARIKRDTFAELIQKCVAEPRKIDPEVNLALPREWRF